MNHRMRRLEELAEQLQPTVGNDGDEKVNEDKGEGL